MEKSGILCSLYTPTYDRIGPNEILPTYNHKRNEQVEIWLEFSNLKKS